MGFGQVWGAVWGAVWALAVLCMACASAQAQQAAAPMALQQLQSAQVQGLGAPQTVRLPHQLAAQMFAPEGSLVSFTLQVDLPEKPMQPVGIYVPKMALSGRLWVNGHLDSQCERGALPYLRCLHRPYLFETPAVYWQAGRNELVFEIYATARQSNGLSSVWVGDVSALEAQFYRWRYWLQVELMRGLTWLSMVVGLLALAAGMVLRKESVYFWFGLTSLANGLANGGIFVSHVLWSGEFFNWFVFSSRLVSSCLGMMMFTAFFDKLTPALRNAGLLFSAVSMVAIGVSGSDRALVSALYVPLMVAAATLMVCLVRWSWQRQRLQYGLASALLGLIFASGIHDWFKLKGQASFEGLYLMTFAYSGMLFLMGSLLLGLLAKGLVQSQALSAELEDRVQARTRELQATHERLMATELAHQQALEQQRLLQDVHDGFGSQLVTAQMLVRHQQLSQEAVAQLLQECIADLHLVISALGNQTHSLQDALADLSHRTEQRLLGTPWQLVWDVQLDPAPKLTHEQVLNLLRILQEALNNALKHAQAEHIEVQVVYTAASRVLLLRVTDHGVGISQKPAQKAGLGVGLATMHKRARQIDAVLTVTDIQPGTCVALRMQLP